MLRSKMDLAHWKFERKQAIRHEAQRKEMIKKKNTHTHRIYTNLYTKQNNRNNKCIQPQKKKKKKSVNSKWSENCSKMVNLLCEIWLFVVGDGAAAAAFHSVLVALNWQCVKFSWFAVTVGWKMGKLISTLGNYAAVWPVSSFPFSTRNRFNCCVFLRPKNVIVCCFFSFFFCGRFSWSFPKLQCVMKAIENIHNEC